MPTEKQINYITKLIFYTESESAKVLRGKLPFQSEDVRNCSPWKFKETATEKLSRKQAIYIIQLLTEYKYKDVQRIFNQVGLIK